MSKLKILSVAFGATLALSAVSGAFAIAPDDSGNLKKEYVCHHTSSVKNPVVIINVGNSALPAHLGTGGHSGHGGTGADASSDSRPATTADCGVVPN